MTMSKSMPDVPDQLAMLLIAAQQQRLAALEAVIA